MDERLAQLINAYSTIAGWSEMVVTASTDRQRNAAIAKLAKAHRECGAKVLAAVAAMQEKAA